tara:strand:+ start:2486 stop:3988 length:1503 start_codon:yes stop_codon:yes gene_type:complete
MSLKVQNENKIDGISSLINKLFYSSGLYAISKLINIIFSFISFSLIARNFSPDQFGRLDFLLTSIIFLVNLSIFGQDQALGRLINDPIDNSRKEKLALNGFLSQLIVSIVLCICLYLIAIYIFIPLGIPFIKDLGKRGFLIFISQIPFFVIINAGLGLLQWSSKRNYYAILSSISTILPAILLALFLPYRTLSITEVLSIFLVARILLSLLTINFCSKTRLIVINSKFDIDLIKNILFFSTPLGLVVCIETVSPIIQRVLISNYLDDLSLGLFALAYKISSVSLIIGSSFTSAWGPLYLKFYKKSNSSEVFIFVLKIIILFSSILTIILSLYSYNFINILANESYERSALLILPIAFGLSLELVNDVTGAGLFIRKKNYYYTLSYIIFILTFCSSFLVMLPLLDFIAIGYSFLFASIFRFLFITYSSNRFYFIKWPTLQIFIFFLLTYSFSFFFTYVYIVDNIWLKNLILLSISSLFLIIFAFSMTKVEVKAFKQIISIK